MSFGSGSSSKAQPKEDFSHIKEGSGQTPEPKTRSNITPATLDIAPGNSLLADEEDKQKKLGGAPGLRRRQAELLS